VYDSSNLNQVRQFALSDAIEVMVMTLGAHEDRAYVAKQIAAFQALKEERVV
jgi:hypothetical protein